MLVDVNEVGNPIEYKVFLNGEPVHLAVRADTEHGTVLVCEIDWYEKQRTGKDILIPDDDSPYRWRTIELKGNVEIRKDSDGGK